MSFDSLTTSQEAGILLKQRETANARSVLLFFLSTRHLAKFLLMTATTRLVLFAGRWVRSGLRFIPATLAGDACRQKPNSQMPGNQMPSKLRQAHSNVASASVLDNSSRCSRPASAAAAMMAVVRERAIDFRRGPRGGIEGLNDRAQAGVSQRRSVEPLLDLHTSNQLRESWRQSFRSQPAAAEMNDEGHRHQRLRGGYKIVMDNGSRPLQIAHLELWQIRGLNPQIWRVREQSGWDIPM